MRTGFMDFLACFFLAGSVNRELLLLATGAALNHTFCESELEVNIYRFREFSLRSSELQEKKYQHTGD